MTSFELSIASDLTSFVSQEIRKLGIRIDQGVVLGTPVDTGAARGSWLVGIGTAPKGKGDNDQAGFKAIQQGISTIGTYPTTELPLLWIVNNQPYIGRLNDGWSLKAPSKYIDAVIQKAVRRGR